MNGFKILVVDDEAKMRNLIKLFLTSNGFEVFEAKNGAECLELMKTSNHDLVILDIMMPLVDGMEVCERIRKMERIKASIPILMLTAKKAVQDRVNGLMAGADDYLVKPFAPEELVARVISLLRRTATNPNPKDKKLLSIGCLEMDFDSRTVKMDSQFIDLTPKEFEILHYLGSNPERVSSREHLLEVVWGYNYVGDARAVDTHIKRLRKKFSETGLDKDIISTIWGVGYKFSVDSTK